MKHKPLRRMNMRNSKGAPHQPVLARKKGVKQARKTCPVCFNSGCACGGIGLSCAGDCCCCDESAAVRKAREEGKSTDGMW